MCIHVYLFSLNFPLYLFLLGTTRLLDFKIFLTWTKVLLQKEIKIKISINFAFFSILEYLDLKKCSYLQVFIISVWAFHDTYGTKAMYSSKCIETKIHYTRLFGCTRLFFFSKISNLHVYSDYTFIRKGRVSNCDSISIDKRRKWRKE